MDLFTQYIRALIVSVAFFCTGVALIEFASTKFIAWCGRATVLCSIAILGFFGWYAVEVCERYCSQLTEEQRREKQPLVEPATKIAQQADAGADYSVTLSDGSNVSWSLTDVSLRRREQRSRTVNAGRSSRSVRFTGSPFAGFDELRNGAQHDDGRSGRTVWYGRQEADGAEAF